MSKTDKILTNEQEALLRKLPRAARRTVLALGQSNNPKRRKALRRDLEAMARHR